MTLKTWKRKHARAIDLLDSLRDLIDELGTEGDQIVGYHPRLAPLDEIACYASNTLEGTRALLEKLRDRVAKEPT